MKNIIILFSSFLFIQCSVDRTILSITDNETITLENFQKLDSLNKVIIANEKEPGEKLILCLTYIDKATKKAISNRHVSLYHTSTDGKYKPSNTDDETTARLNGTATTNEDGKIFVRTILPGDYGSMEDRRHIHTTIYAAKPRNYDIFFNQYSGRMGKFMNSGNDHMFYADLKKTTDDILICFVTIEVNNPEAKD
jgi:hypothetical protein